MAIIESGGKAYPVHEPLEEVLRRLRPVLDGVDDADPYLELDLVDGGTVFVSSVGAVVAVTESPRAARTVGFGS